eukprot:jgi/Mesvir1/18783/Mv01289-RA.1
MRPKKSAIHEGVRALHRLAQKAMDAPEDTPQQRRQKARALSELLIPMMRVHQARTGSLFDDLDYYPPYVHAGYGAAYGGGREELASRLESALGDWQPSKHGLIQDENVRKRGEELLAQVKSELSRREGSGAKGALPVDNVLAQLEAENAGGDAAVAELEALFQNAKTPADLETAKNAAFSLLKREFDDKLAEKASEEYENALHRIDPADDLFKREGLPKAPLDLPADVYHEAVESWMNANRPKGAVVTRGQKTTLPINKNGHVQITAIKEHLAAANKRMGWSDAMLKKAKADGITDTEFIQLRTVAFADKELWQRVNGERLTVHQPQSGEGTKTRKVSLAQGTSELYTKSNRQYRVPYPRFDSFPYDVFPSLDWYDVDG